MYFKNLLNRYFVFSIAIILLTAGSLFSVNYTAITSGNWSSSSTWGGLAPGTNLTNKDVTIPIGIDVTLDADVIIGLNSSITVNGSLVGIANNITMNFGSFGGSGLLNISIFDCGASTNINLLAGVQFSCDTLLHNGALAGAGIINAGFIDCGAAGTINMPTGTVLNSIFFLNDGNIGGSGTYNIGKLDCGATANINLAAGGNLICDTLKNQLNVITIADGTLQINHELELIAGSIRLTNNALLSLSDTCLIRMRGGRIKNYTSNDIVAPLNVELSNNADTLSNDLSLGEAHFGNISFNFTNPSQEIVLGEDIFVEGTFDFSNGVLNLFNHFIKFYDDFKSDQGRFKGSTTCALFFENSGETDTLKFEPGYENLCILDVSRDTNLILGTNLDVDSALNFSGQKLMLNGNNLNVNGDFSLGNGMITGSTTSGLSFNGNGLIDTLEFTPGQNILNQFSVNIDTLNQVILGSDVHIIGTMFTTSGEVVLQGTTLTVSGSITKNKGLFVGSASASMVIEGIDTAGIIAFKPGFEFLDSLVLNRQGTIVNGMSTGVLWLQGDLNLNTLKVENGMFGLNGEDSTLAKASNGKNVTVNSTTDMNGMVGVASSGPMKNFGMQIDLNLNGDLITTATGLFAANTNLDINISGTGSMDTLAFAAAYDTLASLVYDNAQELVLGSDIAIWDTLSMTSGTINIANSTLSINGTLIIDYAAFIGSPMANMIISGSANIDTLIFLAQTAELNNFTVSVDSGNSVTLGGDLTVNGNVYMISGELVLSGDTLTVNGNIIAENGSLSGNADATLIIGGIDSTSVLTFTEGAQELKELILNSIGDTLLLGSNLQIDSLLTLTQGMLNIGSYNLTIDSLASITGFNKYNYIAISDTGKLIQYINNTSISVTFPIGTLSAYTPVTLNQNSVTEFGQYAANVIEGVYASGDSGAVISENAVNTTWNVSTTLTDYNVSMQVGWSQSQEMTSFNSDSCYISHFNGTAWDTIPADSAIQDTSGMFYIQRDSITGMSPFAVMSNNPTVCQMVSTTLITNASSSVSYDGAINIAVTNGLSPFTYSWTPSIGQLSIINPDSAVIDGLNTGTYMITVSDNNGCEVIDTFYVDFTISIKNELTEKSVKIYPNPSDGILFVENAENSSIEIYNILGNTVMKTDKTKFFTRIDVSSYAKGIYFVKINKDETLLIRRIIIE